MESTISTEDLKAKLDRKDSVTVVETLAPERYHGGHLCLVSLRPAPLSSSTA